MTMKTFLKTNKWMFALVNSTFNTSEHIKTQKNQSFWAALNRQRHKKMLWKELLEDNQMVLKSTLCMRAASLPLQVLFVWLRSCLQCKLVSTSHERQLVIAPMLFTHRHSKQRTFQCCIRGMWLASFEAHTGLLCCSFMLMKKVNLANEPKL